MTNTKNTRRIGPKMEQVAEYVTRNPGCLMIDAARHVHPRAHNFARCCALGYNTVHRAIKAGLVRKVPGVKRGTYALEIAA